MLASNFAGSTSALLSLDGGRLAGRLKADALFPVAGYKRCLDTQNGYGGISGRDPPVHPACAAGAAMGGVSHAFRLAHRPRSHAPDDASTSSSACPGGWGDERCIAIKARPCACPAEFRYPARWLSDQRLYQRYAERVERSNGLDPPSLSRFAAYP